MTQHCISTYCQKLTNIKADSVFVNELITKSKARLVGRQLQTYLAHGK